MNTIHLRRSLAALVLAAAFLCQETWALAGTTGNLTGTLTDSATNKPIAGARVTANSPSQAASAITDAGGRFTLLSLAPDTYTVSADVQGYAPVSVAGITIFADQTQSLALTTHPELKTIARVTSRAAGNLLKPGVTSDTYSVNAAGAQAALALGGGGNLDNAYSAIASVPGLNLPIGGAGWNENVYIRGNQSFFTSYEYDGVPVNRAFDNYNASTESSLGLQQLQVYTGGGPASNSSAGTSGFVNQVIKTGTYPGFGELAGSLGLDAFYHSGKVEAGGASPDRNFSYYVGLSGYDQDYRYINNTNGGDLVGPNGEFNFAGQYSTDVGAKGTNGRGVWPVCNPGTNVSPIPSSDPSYLFGYAGQCFIDDPAAALFGDVGAITDRENVVNFHFAIPHRNGQRDDLQLLWSASAMNSIDLSSPNDAGGLAAYTLAVTGSPYCPPTQAPGAPAYCFDSKGGYVPNYPSYVDAIYDYNLPFGTPIQNAAGVDTPTMTYLQPSSNQNRLGLDQLPADLRDTFHNDTGVVKMQYTRSLGANAYARLFGYTFFSDWTQAAANSAYNCYVWGIGGPNDCGLPANYDLITHTAGGEFQLADQINPQHLLQFTANYTTASVSRFNNSGYILDSPYGYGGSFVAYLSQSNGQFQCWNAVTGQASPSCRPGNGATAGTFWDVAGDGPYPTAPAGSPAANAGAQWVTLQNGSTYGTYNTVRPDFLFTALTDDFRPNDKLDINLGLRWDRYLYNLQPLTPGTAFYAQIVQQEVCQNSTTGSILTTPLKPGQPPPAPVNYTATCPSGYVHPAFSASSPSSYLLQALSPRLQFSYTLDPSTVIRGEVGRYTEPPISASVQYLNSSGNALTVWNATLPLGFHTPFHPIPIMSSIQSDLSLEHQFHGTDVSAKLTPFFNVTNGYQEQSFIGPNFATQVPVGAFRSYGLEAAISKGDYNRNGLSGQLAFTWTNAAVQYQAKFFGDNEITDANAAIAQFNTLTQAGGGAQCYGDSLAGANSGQPIPCSSAHAVLNPYYSLPSQNMLDPNGWYAPGNTGLSATNNPSVGYFDAPIVASLILNYKHDKFSITPSFQLSQGSSYGGPYDVTGLDPRACSLNSADAGITAVSAGTNPNQCDYLSLTSGNASASPVAGQFYIPNPQTGMFAKPGQFRDPWIATMNLQLKYDVSPKVTALLTLADVWHTCFGGSKEPWTAGAYSPNTNNCAYGPNGLYTSNFYNGTGPLDAAANGQADQYWETQSYLPSFYGSTGSSTPWPFNAYFQVQVKL